MNDVHKVSAGFIIGVIFSFLVFLPVGVSAHRAIRELQQHSQNIEIQLESSIAIITELGIQNQELTHRESEIAESLERSRRRNSELTELVSTTGRELEAAITESGNLTEILQQLVRIVDKLFPDIPGNDPEK